ncbi:MAG TPA: hypothetical protein VGR40_04875 [Candidatus Binatus sp.]|nr:hypothetical protein [Candidatus Binatus sp.]
MLTLFFQLLLLLLDLGLSLLIRVVLILHSVAYREAADSADRSAYRRACARGAYRSSDNSAGCSADRGASDSAFLTRGQRIARTSGDQKDRSESKQCCCESMSSHNRCSLFGFALALQLLNLLLLIFDLPLLRRNLSLRLRLLILSILHLVAHRETAQRADTTANRGARAWCTDRRSDYSSGRGPDSGADKRAFLTRREWLSGASDHRHDRNRHEQTL